MTLQKSKGEWFAEKSKEYSDLNEIIDDAKSYISFENEKID